MPANRRSFLKASSVAALAFGGAGAASAQPPSDPPFAHHIFYWLKEPKHRATYDGIVRSLQSFRTIKEVKFLHVGAPTALEAWASATDTTYTLSYFTLFESKGDLENYLKHPLHDQFMQRYKDAFSKVVIYDSIRVAG